MCCNTLRGFGVAEQLLVLATDNAQYSYEVVLNLMISLDRKLYLELISLEKMIISTSSFLIIFQIIQSILLKITNYFYQLVMKGFWVIQIQKIINKAKVLKWMELAKGFISVGF